MDPETYQRLQRIADKLIEDAQPITGETEMEKYFEGVETAVEAFRAVMSEFTPTDEEVAALAELEAAIELQAAVAPFEVEPGRIDLRILEQDRIWIDLHGNAHWLTAMVDSYLRNVRGVLLERAPQMQRITQHNETRSVFTTASDREDWIAESAYDGTPEEWMRRRPLFRAIERALEPITEGAS